MGTWRREDDCSKERFSEQFLPQAPILPLTAACFSFLPRELQLYVGYCDDILLVAACVSLSRHLHKHLYLISLQHLNNHPSLL